MIGNLLFPALAMFFFVVPQSAVAADPLWSHDRGRRSSACSP